MGSQISLASPEGARHAFDMGMEVAGSTENHFLAITNDGRAVRLLQVERCTKRGVQAWLPDGTPVPAKNRIHLGYAFGRSPDLFYLIFRFISPSPTANIDGSNANHEYLQRLGGVALWENYSRLEMKGKVSASGPDIEYFAGDWVEPFGANRPGTRIAVNCVRIPAIGRFATDSYQFQWADGPWAPVKSIGIPRPCDQPINALAVYREKLDARSPTQLKFELCDYKKSWTGPSDGALPQQTLPNQFANLSFPSTYLGQLELVPRAVDVNGKRFDGNVLGASYGDECSMMCNWPELFQKLKLIEIEGRMVEHADFLDVRLRPNRTAGRRS